MTIFTEWLDANGLTHEPHQIEAVEWCLKREQAPSHKGGIIADEMGLGKTIEMLGTVYSNSVPNTLIVLPYSLLLQWEKIITKLMGFPPLVYHGSKRKSLTEAEIKLYPIVLTTYGLISQKPLLPLSDTTTTVDANPLHTIKWDRVIYDEAHHLRNKKTAVNVGAHLVRADITWLMTGTPIQNGESDLYNLYDLLGFVNIIPNIDMLVHEYMLRRTKEKAGIVLPACRSSIIPVEWKYKKERILAEKIHAQLKFSNLALLQQETQVPQTITVVEHPLKLLNKAKKICSLPKLMKRPCYRLVLEDEEGVITKTPAKMFKDASKIESVVATILAKKDNGKAKLVFCYFHDEIDEIYQLLKVQGINVKKFDGRTSKKERTRILSEPCAVLVGQIDTMNEGLNLQAYTEIYMVSPHWNPAVEDQAIARSHRIGQTEPVDVFHFQMNGFSGYDLELEKESALNIPVLKALTLDQHIGNVQESKRKIVHNLLKTTSKNNLLEKGWTKTTTDGPNIKNNKK
jgi:non-specific serine/threonine protein kinase